jgi:hypothetical protein
VIRAALANAVERLLGYPPSGSTLVLRPGAVSAIPRRLATRRFLEEQPDTFKPPVDVPEHYPIG